MVSESIIGTDRWDPTMPSLATGYRQPCSRKVLLYRNPLLIILGMNISTLLGGPSPETLPNSPARF
ncbi:hypothetical protein ACRALDRAFT_1063645, partial [Sodiomyces alcalophilus JCM 7366]|uniref:uncharacterized protein n=1 Tax=Sodiomyces alcalophilus JCM 7366 TaxID=591952 RepID=UPI0039B373E4